MNINTISMANSFGKTKVNSEQQQLKNNYKNINFKNLYDDFQISSYPYIPGKKIVQCLGPVYGNSLWSRNIGKDFGAFFKTIAGGKINAYSELAKMTQRDAIEDMIKSAKEIGANAIIGYFNTERGLASDSFMRTQGIAVKVEDGDCNQDIEEMKRNGVKIAV